MPFNSSPIKGVPTLQVIILDSQPYSQVADQCSEITQKKFQFEEKENHIVSAVYSRDFMSDMSKAYDNFSILLNTKHSSLKSLISFEAYFSAAVYNFNFFLSMAYLSQ